MFVSLHIKFGMGIYLLFLLPGNGGGVEWIRFLYGGSVKNEGDKYSVSKFLGMMT
jgi:hypothetical protein